MKKILITGANGQLGTEMQLMAADYPQYEYVFTDVAELNICDEAAVDRFIAEKEIDVVVNCAAYTAVDKAEDDEAFCALLNGEAPGFLAKAVARRKGRLIHVSTDYVFDGTAHIPYKEEQETCPNSVYGRTKLLGEQKALQASERTVVLRTAWLYSPLGNNFVKTMIRLGKEKSELGVIFDQIGTPTYAKDLADVIFRCIAQEDIAGIFHFSNEGVCSWYDFTKAIHEEAGISSCRVKPLHTSDYPTKATRPHYSVLDKSKIKRTLQIEIPYWKDSLRDCINRLEK